MQKYILFREFFVSAVEIECPLPKPGVCVGLTDTLIKSNENNAKVLFCLNTELSQPFNTLGKACNIIPDFISF